MTAFLTGIHRMLRPAHGDAHGPLPPLLVAMTVVTGLVDAFSYLGLGHVFVANMTGNVVFLAFALAGAKGFSVPASLAALASFATGAAAGGRVDDRLSGDRARLLGISGSLQCLVLVVAVVLDATGGTAPAWSRYGLIVTLAAAMGIQNAAARKLAVPDLTTTVLTLTITGIAADHPGSAPVARTAGRRVVAITAMFVGALVGAAFVVGHHGVYPVVLAALLVAGVVIAVLRLGAGSPPWARTAR